MASSWDTADDALLALRSPTSFSDLAEGALPRVLEVLSPEYWLRQVQMLIYGAVAADQELPFSLRISVVVGTIAGISIAFLLTGGWGWMPNAAGQPLEPLFWRRNFLQTLILNLSVMAGVLGGIVLALFLLRFQYGDPPDLVTRVSGG